MQYLLHNINIVEFIFSFQAR